MIGDKSTKLCLVKATEILFGKNALKKKIQDIEWTKEYLQKIQNHRSLCLYVEMGNKNSSKLVITSFTKTTIFILFKNMRI